MTSSDCTAEAYVDGVSSSKKTTSQTPKKICNERKKSVLIPTEQQFLFPVKKRSFLKTVPENKLGKEDAK